MARAAYFLQLLQALKNMGLDPADIYEPQWLAEISKLDADPYRPVEEWDRMMVQAEQHTQGVDMALKMAESLKPWDTGPVGFLTMTCRTLVDAAWALVQFYGLFNDVYKIDAGITGDRLYVNLIPLGAVRSVFVERLTLALIVGHARALSRRDDLSFDASFTCGQPTPENLPMYQRAFGGHLSFNATQSGLGGPAVYAELPVAASPSSGRVQDMLRTQMLAEMEALQNSTNGFIYRVEGVLKARLESGETGLDDVAAELGVSSRTLQSRLEASGLSYRGLLDRMRHAQALAYVSDPSISLINATQMLGFASQSAFQRAFKRWTGMTPGDYRLRRPPV